jgi:ABC-type Fe3+ transport system substrate-binding protein
VKPIDPFYGKLVPIGIMTRAVHPNSAQLFIDYALSSEGQELFRSLEKIPARGGSAPTIKIDRDKIRMIPAEESVNTAYYAKLSDNLFVKGTR